MAPRPRFVLPLPDGRALDLGSRTLLMAILNVTPDSFADGGVHADPDVAIAAALTMAAAGADLIDIGAESTRPGALPLPPDEERRRLEPVLEGLRGRLTVPISVDTYKADVAARALELGASMINDVSGLTFDPALAGVAARAGAPLVLMHHRGRSQEMYALARYDDVVADVTRELGDRVRTAEALGVPRSRIVVDPGIGFAKRAEHSWAVLAGLPALAALGCPVLVGPSRKSFLTSAIGDVPASDRLFATAAVVAVAALQGAHIVRVHDVAEMADVVRSADAVRDAGLESI